MRPDVHALASLCAVAMLLTAGCTEHTIYGQTEERPIAIAAIESVDQDGQDALVTYVQRPFGTSVQLDGTQSYDPQHADFTYDFLDYEWEFVLTPPGSEAVLEFPHVLEGTDVVDTARPTFLADVSGAYRLSLRVTNAETELTSKADYVAIQATPWEGLQIDMYWTTPATDVDLHVIAPNGTYFDVGDPEDPSGVGSDCFFANPNPDWGVEGTSADNPLYSGDDDNGGDVNNPAAETVQLESPAEGVYTVVVSYHSDRHTGQTVQPWVEATIAGEELQPRIDAPEALDELDTWIVMEIEMPEMEVTVIDEMSTHEDMGGPPIND